MQINLRDENLDDYYEIGVKFQIFLFKFSQALRKKILNWKISSNRRIQYWRIILFEENFWKKKNQISFHNQEIIRHESYSHQLKKNDIALIRTRKEFIFSSSARPACLETNMQDLDTDVQLDIAGWGSSSAERKIDLKFMKYNNKWRLIHSIRPLN